MSPDKAALMTRFDDPKDFLHRDIPYGKTHPEAQKLDAYLVKSSQPAPVAIEIHGGGWRRGSKSQFVYPGDLVGAILAAGISVVSIRDPHSAWHSVLLAEALVKAGGTAVSRIGPEVGKDPEADVAAILSFLREQLLSEEMSPDGLERVLDTAPIAFVPVGTFEHHGWHLPVCFDGIKAHALCERGAERTGGTVLPTNEPASPSR